MHRVISDTKDLIIAIWIFAAIVSILIFICIMQWKAAKKNITIPSVIGEEWFKIPVIVSTWAPSFFPTLLRIGYNNIYPLLVLYDDKIRMRSMFLSHIRTWNDFKKVTKGPFQNSILFYLKSWRRESFNLMNKHNVDQVIDFLRTKWVTVK